MPVLKDRKKLTGSAVEEVVALLPEELEPQYLAALIMTLVDNFMGDKPSAAMGLLISTTITYARTIGTSDEKTASVLRSVADDLVKEHQSKKVH